MLKKNFNDFKFDLEKDVLGPYIQIRKKKYFPNKINHKFGIQLETRKEESMKCNRQ
jgi:hypothetical protein